MLPPRLRVCAPGFTVLALLLAGGLTASRAEGQAVSTGDLDGMSAVPPTPSAGTGTADVTVDGDQLTVGALGLTMMACEDALMAQESQFLAALQTPTTIEVSGPMVTLRAADGATQVTLTRP